MSASATRFSWGSTLHARISNVVLIANLQQIWKRDEIKLITVERKETLTCNAVLLSSFLCSAVVISSRGLKWYQTSIWSFHLILFQMFLTPVKTIQFGLIIDWHMALIYKWGEWCTPRVYPFIQPPTPTPSNELALGASLCVPTTPFIHQLGRARCCGGDRFARSAHDKGHSSSARSGRQAVRWICRGSISGALPVTNAFALVKDGRAWVSMPVRALLLMLS